VVKFACHALTVTLLLALVANIAFLAVPVVRPTLLIRFVFRALLDTVQSKAVFALCVCLVQLQNQVVSVNLVLQVSVIPLLYLVNVVLVHPATRRFMAVFASNVQLVKTRSLVDLVVCVRLDSALSLVVSVCLVQLVLRLKYRVVLVFLAVLDSMRQAVVSAKIVQQVLLAMPVKPIVFHASLVLKVLVAVFVKIVAPEVKLIVYCSSCVLFAMLERSRVLVLPLALVARFTNTLGKRVKSVFRIIMSVATWRWMPTVKPLPISTFSAESVICSMLMAAEYASSIEHAVRQSSISVWITKTTMVKKFLHPKMSPFNSFLVTS